MSETSSDVWVVDRVDAGIAVLVEYWPDDTASDPAADDLVVIQLAASLLGDDAVEGAVLVVPVGSVGEPVWDEARRDVETEDALRAAADDTLAELRKRDPGGDVSL